MKKADEKVVIEADPNNINKNSSMKTRRMHWSVSHFSFWLDFNPGFLFVSSPTRFIGRNNVSENYQEIPNSARTRIVRLYLPITVKMIIINNNICAKR